MNYQQFEKRIRLLKIYLVRRSKRVWLSHDCWTSHFKKAQIFTSKASAKRAAVDIDTDVVPEVIGPFVMESQNET